MDRRDKTGQIINVGLPANAHITDKATEKVEKYLDLGREILRL